MSIFGISPKRAHLNEEIKRLEGQLAMQVQLMGQQADEHRFQMQQIKHLVVDDILSIAQTQRQYKGNAYPGYQEALDEILRKYNGTADWGVLQTGAIVDLRAAFIIGEGLTITRKAPKKLAKIIGKEIPQGEGAPKIGMAEEQFCETFLEFNDLDKEIIQEFAKEAELEGRILLRLFWDSEYQMVSVRFIPWSEKKYKVITDPQDYLWYKEVTWDASSVLGKEWRAEKLTEPEFVYKKFGGRINEPNTAAPRLMKCLTQIENLDKALRDLREINNMFAGPVPDIKLENEEQVTEAQAQLANLNFGKIRKLFAHRGEFNYKQPSMDGVDSLIKEIEMLAKMISGTTGIPVHYLGLLDILRNRATGENLYDLLFGSTSKERQIWKGVYKEIIEKAMAIYNANATDTKQMSEGKKLNSAYIEVDIPTIGQEQWDRIKDVWLPAALGGKISDELFLQQIPGIDMEEELQRKKEAEESELAQMKDENKSLRQDMLNRNLNQGNQEE